METDEVVTTKTSFHRNYLPPGGKKLQKEFIDCKIKRTQYFNRGAKALIAHAAKFRKRTGANVYLHIAPRVADNNHARTFLSGRLKNGEKGLRGKLNSTIATVMQRDRRRYEKLRPQLSEFDCQEKNCLAKNKHEVAFERYDAEDVSDISDISEISDDSDEESDVEEVVEVCSTKEVGEGAPTLPPRLHNANIPPNQVQRETWTIMSPVRYSVTVPAATGPAATGPAATSPRFISPTSIHQAPRQGCLQYLDQPISLINIPNALRHTISGSFVPSSHQASTTQYRLF